MLWVDLSIAAVALLVLALVGFSLFRRVKGLIAVGKTSSAAVSASMPAPPAPRSRTT